MPKTMINIDANNQSPKYSGWRVARWFIAFFGVMMVANVIFLLQALNSWPGVETKAAYDKGLQYNELIEKGAAAKALNWDMTSNVYDLPGANGTAIEFVVADANSLAVEGLTVVGKLERPASRSFDISITFKETRPGFYYAQVNLLDVGQWDLRVLMIKEDIENRYSERLMVTRD